MGSNLILSQTVKEIEKYINDKIIKYEVYRTSGIVNIIPIHYLMMEESGLIKGFHYGKINYKLHIKPEDVNFTCETNAFDRGSSKQRIKIKCSYEVGRECITSLWSGVNIHGQNVINQYGTEQIVALHFNLGKLEYEAVCLAFKEYFDIALDKSNNAKKKKAESDPFLNKVLEKENKKFIPLIKKNGVYQTPVTLNDLITLDFIVDSGAGDMFISPDVLLTLIRGKTITEDDYIGELLYSFANGKSESCKVYSLDNVKIGETVVKNVRCAVANSIIGEMLLGQSFLEKLGSYTVDYDKGQIIIE